MTNNIRTTMTNNESQDLEFHSPDQMLNPFQGTMRFTVKKKIKIVYFEFSSHDIGCYLPTGLKVQYRLRLTLNGKVLFAYHNYRLDVQVKRPVILTPGNTYKLETWVGRHRFLPPGKECSYHYTEISRSKQSSYVPFNFIFTNEENAESTNTTCLYVISYKIID